nr:hypothetical protein [Tanacetum cinerariifolium]
KQIEADDQAIQTILLSLPEDIYAAVDVVKLLKKSGFENQVAQNPRVQNDEIQNQIGNGNLVAVRAEGNAAGHNGN